MSPEEVRAIRGALSRAAFARLLGVTPLTVLRWELPQESKEARRPRAKLIEAIRKLASEEVGSGPRANDDDDESDEAASEPVAGSRSDETTVGTPRGEEAARVHSLLDRLATESWPVAENQILSLLSSGALETSEARLLATLGIAQAQLFGRLDLRGALATLLPILNEAEGGKLPRAVAARAHVLAALLFSSPDARFFDPGRMNAHVARAQALLDDSDPAAGELRVYLATAAVHGTRFLGPHAVARAYQAHAPALARACGPLATILAEADRHMAGLMGENRGASAGPAQPFLALVERLKMPYVYLAILAGLAHQAVHATATPEQILALVKEAQARAQAAHSGLTEELLRLYGYEIEAHTRQGHFGEAEAAYRTALAAAQRDRMPIYPLVAAACHLFVLLGRRADLAHLVDAVEADGPPRAGLNHHAFLARAAMHSVEGETGRAIEFAERVCSAPETTPGIEGLRHYAHAALVLLRMAQEDHEETRAAICRYRTLLEGRPSVWHSIVFRRLDGVALFFEGRIAEARQKLESVLPAFRLLGEVTQHALAELNLAVVARASGAPNADDRVAAAVTALEALGVPRPPSLQRMMRVQVQPAAWADQTLCERLIIALARLSVPGLRADQMRSEVASIVGGLFPHHSVSVAPVTSADATARDGVDVPDGQGGLLRVSVDGTLSAEQLSALRLLEALAPSASAVVRAAREAESPSDVGLPNFIAGAPATQRLKREIAQLSKSTATILITGESGSGKEVVACGVHELSSRADKPYIAFNCASVPRDLFEGQLFGYKKGAFTGATSDNPGVIRAADGGTLFLDEIAELPLDTQPKLLRFLENGEIFPVGEQRPRHVDVRILAATHGDLGRFVHEGRFREDLFYRLNVVPLWVPPLRERIEDILPLARTFIERLAPDGQERPQLGADAVVALETHTWPGNVRELRNVIERAMAYAPVPTILRAEHLRLGRR